MLGFLLNSFKWRRKQSIADVIDKAKIFLWDSLKHSISAHLLHNIFAGNLSNKITSVFIQNSALGNVSVPNR